MSMDPYAPPLSPMNGQTPADSNAGMRYSGFWRRVGAALIDFLIISPLLFANFYMGDSQQYYLYSILPIQLFTFIYYVFLVAKFGATPGKLVMNMRVAMLDGSPITFKAACLRYGLWWILGLMSAVGMAMAATTMSAESLDAGYMQRSAFLTAEMPGWAIMAGYANQLLALVSIIMLIFNKQRRTVHDFIAGTVVLLKK